MLELDGSEGGGQLFRSALAFSAMTGTAIEMTDVRGSRPDPGLRPQHLAVLDVLADISNATVHGREIGATTVTFDPEDPRGGRYSADIGTAGSIPLLFDAVVPLATVLEEPLVLTATGGTDVQWSPPMAYHRQVKLPVLADHGVHAGVTVDRPGFYPAGGGEATLCLAPSTLESFALGDPGGLVGARIYATASMDLQDADVATRQATAAADALAAAGVDVTAVTTQHSVTPSTGSSLVIRLDFEASVAGVSALGERGKPAEHVASEAVDRALDVRDSPAAVDAHLADQLVPFLAAAGGEISIPDVTDHVESHCRLLAAFGLDIEPVQDVTGLTLVG
ncbi:RNA 3'-terminal phosphate cyclase [Halorhabdus sp. CBA1104]|uniref:RNA 3'-terminal phosphate cyclase n=1 Tax=unclassified Halorhabdus TaxID=2621901 RepID=UPI0012B3380C|nr:MULTISPECIES: RNA 3'-terminal phosphate cyclase [unclassified Halorhabdus]QGN06090.1 RNA 3'-terminal phosphate cyclase [Halorhabdus sp. CBA1104]